MAETSAYRVNETPILLAYPFRPFFLLTGLYGALLVAAWVAFLFAGLPLSLGISAPAWRPSSTRVQLAPASALRSTMPSWPTAQPCVGVAKATATRSELDGTSAWRQLLPWSSDSSTWPR